MKIVFFTLMDDSFFPGYEGFFKSLLYFNPNFTYFFYILDNGISEKTWEKMKAIYPFIERIRIDKTKYKIEKKSTKTELLSTYFKLEIFNPENKSLGDKFIFMDMDILIQGDLKDLLSIDIQGKTLGACKQWNRKKDECIEEINSGVLVIDTEKLTDELYHTLLDKVEQGFFLPDQDIINKVFVKNKDCFYLPKEFNVEKRMIETKNLQDILTQAKCLHFVNTKPWQDEAEEEKKYASLYEKWWSFFPERKKSPSFIPEEFKKDPFIFITEKNCTSIKNRYQSIFLNDAFKYVDSFLANLIANHLEVGGLIGGNSPSLKKSSLSGRLIKILKRNFDIQGKDYWGFIKREKDLNFLKQKKSFSVKDSNLLEVSEEEYKKFLFNKTVVFVGPSPIIKGKQLGEFIDSFDIVVRTNNMLNTLRDYPEIEIDYGSRCDILYVNVTYERDCYQEWDFNSWKERDLKIICKLMGSKAKEDLPFSWRRVPNSLLKLPPPTLYLGTRLIHDLLQFPIKSLYVTGVDAYESISYIIDGKNEEYLSDYLPVFTQKQRIKNIGLPVSLHDKHRDTRFILGLEKEEERFLIDSHCKKKMEKVAYYDSRKN